MRTPPGFSVVIPMFNEADSILRALHSVSLQRWQPQTIIVVDDGSTDDSVQQVAQLHWPQLILLQQTHRGVSAARNRGLRAATTPYVAFLDADDYWLDTHIESLAELIQVFPDRGLYSTHHDVCIHGKRHTPTSGIKRGALVDIDDFMGAFAHGLALINSTTACVDREKCLTVGGFPEGVSRGEDIITWITMARAYGMAHRHRVTAVYDRTTSITKKNHLPISARDTLTPPESLHFIAALARDPQLSDQERNSARILLDRMTFFLAAGLSEQGLKKSARALGAFAQQHDRHALSWLIWLASAMPSEALRIARRIRHAQSTA